MSKLYSCLNVKEPLARKRCDICSYELKRLWVETPLLSCMKLNIYSSEFQQECVGAIDFSDGLKLQKSPIAFCRPEEREHVITKVNKSVYIALIEAAA